MSSRWRIVWIAMPSKVYRAVGFTPLSAWAGTRYLRWGVGREQACKRLHMSEAGYEAPSRLEKGRAGAEPSA